MSTVLATPSRNQDACNRLPHDLLGTVIEHSCVPIVVYRGTDVPVYLNASARSLWPSGQTHPSGMYVLVDGEPRAVAALRSLEDHSGDSGTVTIVRVPTGGEYGVDTCTWTDPSGGRPWQVVILRPLRRAPVEAGSLEDKIDRLKSIVHEFRNTLTAAKEAVTFVEEGTFGELNAEQHRFMRSAKDDLEHLGRALADLTVLWATPASVFRISLRPVDIRSVVEQSSVYARPVAERANISLGVETPDSLPPFVGDHDLLVQALRNVLTNALQHTPSGGEIHVRTLFQQSVSPATEARGPDASLQSEVGVRPAGEIVIEILDTGRGISARDKERMFRPFERGNPGAPEAHPGKATGMGLGLAIAREIAWTHGGTLGVEAGPERGSCFIFRFPLSEASASRGLERVIQRAIDESDTLRVPLATVLLELECADNIPSDFLFLSVQQAVTGNLRPTDTVLAVDNRSLILMRGGTRGLACAVAERIQGALTGISQRHATAFGGGRVRYGVAAYPEDGDRADTLLRCAERGMHEAATDAGPGTAS